MFKNFSLRFCSKISRNCKSSKFTKSSDSKFIQKIQKFVKIYKISIFSVNFSKLPTQILLKNSKICKNLQKFKIYRKYFNFLSQISLKKSKICKNSKFTKSSD